MEEIHYESLKREIGLAVIVRNEAEYSKLQNIFGKELIYLDWVPQMAVRLTGIVLWYSDEDLFSIGSLGCAEHQKKSGIVHVEFSEHFKNL